MNFLTWSCAINNNIIRIIGWKYVSETHDHRPELHLFLVDSLVSKQNKGPSLYIIVKLPLRLKMVSIKLAIFWLIWIYLTKSFIKMAHRIDSRVQTEVLSFLFCFVLKIFTQYSKKNFYCRYGMELFLSFSTWNREKCKTCNSHYHFM